MAKKPINIVYCSWSNFKKEEWAAAKENLELASRPGTKIGELFEMDFRRVRTSEPLLCDIEAMVKSKIESAYREVQIPCIVEHAGLILEGYETQSFPGGLTQPMWDSLEATKFVGACSTLSRKATARAVIGYCDGMNISTFIGETKGSLSDTPRGDRGFYWDTVFIPEEGNGQTYSEMVGRSRSGLLSKLKISQSMKALKGFLEHRLLHETELFPTY